MSILVVETATPPMLADRLRARGWPVVTASDDPAAMAILESRADVVLVVTDAIPVIAAIRAHAELRSLPIVACSDDHVREVRHVLARSVDDEALHVVVASVLAEEVPVLESPVEVQARLAIDERAYRRLAANVAALIARTTGTLDQETLAAIAEAGLLIGARRITTALARLRAADGERQADAVRGLRRELRRVYGALRVGPGAPLDATG